MDYVKKRFIEEMKVLDEDNGQIKPSCKNCQTICSAAKKNFSCKDFVPTHIEDK
jgi:hypothetical protein